MMDERPLIYIQSVWFTHTTSYRGRKELVNRFLPFGDIFHSGAFYRHFFFMGFSDGRCEIGEPWYCVIIRFEKPMAAAHHVLFKIWIFMVLIG